MQRAVSMRERERATLTLTHLLENVQLGCERNAASHHFIQQLHASINQPMNQSANPLTHQIVVVHLAALRMALVFVRSRP